MIGGRQRFTPLQRLLHWLMAVCILAMLFIGVGMVSTVMPKYLTLVSIHKPLGIAILVLALVRLGVRLRYGAPSLPADLPEPMKLAAQLSHYALYILMIGMPLLGWGMLTAAAYPVVLFGGVYLPAILPQSYCFFFKQKTAYEIWVSDGEEHALWRVEALRPLFRGDR